MTRWLLVKVLHDDVFDSQYKLNQLDGVDCMEVTQESHPQLYREVVDNFDEDAVPPEPENGCPDCSDPQCPGCSGGICKYC